MCRHGRLRADSQRDPRDLRGLRAPQQWVAANILVEKDAVYLPDILAYFRKGGIPLFGNAQAERGMYTPGQQPPDTDVRMIRNLLAIAAEVERTRGVRIMPQIKRDFA